MGKGRDKRRKQKGSSVAGKGTSKTERKTLQNEKKQERRIDRRLQDDEEDLDALLEKFKLEDKQRTEVILQDDCDGPSVRVHATYTNLPHERNGVVMVFGGEYEDQKDHRVVMFNDLFRFDCEKKKWTKISSPNGPSPRSSHQTVFYKQMLYVFGGEFTSPRQDRFRHFKELWRFDLKTNLWEKLEIKKGPSARSGHRAVVYKTKMIVFGGFNDSGENTVYYSDMWMLDLENLSWEAVDDHTKQKPSPRSGFRMMVYEDSLYIYGGYSRSRDVDDQDIEHGKTMDDLWRFDLRFCKWEKLKNNGIAPGIRSGFNMCLHQHRAIYFGGATDREAKKGESIVSDFHNDLFQFNFERQKWYTVTLRIPKSSKKGHLEDLSSSAAASRLAEEELNYKQRKAAIKIQSSYRGYSVRKAYKIYKLGGKMSELLYSPASYGIDSSILNAPKPRGRISSGMCIVRNDLWLFGGIVEIMDKEITLDDIWCLSLKNYDGWKCIQENSAGEDAFKQDTLSSDSSSTSSKSE